MAARYTLVMTLAAQRDFKSLPGTVQRRIDAHILPLAGDPFPAGSEKLEGLEGLYRVRAGDYRILYTVDTKQRVVTIAKLRPRREAYR
jgi:mRNA interferase RelE/StbE